VRGVVCGLEWDLGVRRWTYNSKSVVEVCWHKGVV
jgi:hypothetical protein